LNTNKLEEQLKLLRTDPLFSNVEASLKPGSSEGKSIVVVRVVEANPITGGVSIDNYSPPSVGSERLGINISDRNLTGNGDQLAASYYRTTTGGANQLDLSYRVPVNAMNGTLQLRAAPSWTRVTQEPFKALDITGSSQLYELTYRQPLVRTPRQEFALALGFAYQDGQTFTFAGPTPFGLGPDENGISRTSVVKFGQDYLRRDSKGAWALRSQFSFGTGLFNATNNPSPVPDGHFFSWLGQVQRVQTLSPNHVLIVQGDIQLSPDSLLPSQQFVIGGGQSLRGYRQNVRAGDNGVRFSIEDRISLQRNQAGESVLQLAPFFDAGTVWNVSNNPNPLPRQNFLASVGLGVLWQPLPKLNLRLDYGLPLVDLDDRGNNAQDQGLYFSAGYQF
ncbi:MAG: ShlB/FhaC/HecB family hemolysin secretion/activation protein, partial [Coleofasciculaceae cyanobacterium]